MYKYVQTVHKHLKKVHTYGHRHNFMMYMHTYAHIALGGIKNISFSILSASYCGITMIPSLKVIVGH